MIDMIDEKKLIEEITNLYNEYANDQTRFEREETKAIYRFIGALTYRIENMPKENEWIPVEERLPKEYKSIDEETGYYRRSDEVLCFRKDDYNGTEYWIDYTIDGEWQRHEYIDGDKLYWMPLPKEYRKEQ